MHLAPVHQIAHRLRVDAPAGVLYGLIADSARWPVFWPSSVHVERLEFDGRRERLRMWGAADGEVRSWTSRRTLDPVARRVDFRHELTGAPVTSMGGSWTVEQLGAQCCLVTLHHDVTVAGAARADADRVTSVIDDNSRTGLDSFKRLAEGWSRLDELVLSFECSVRVDGPGERAYDFLHRFGDRTDAVPGATGIGIAEHRPGVQLMTVDLRDADGVPRTTESVRLGFPHAGRVVHKRVRDTERPALVAAHTGEWSVEPDVSGGVAVVARHDALLDEDGVRRRFGEGADAARAAREELRERLARESARVLGLAKRHAEGARSGVPEGAGGSGALSVRK
ncbi:aromatase/cyclase [Streptomyces sp. O3]